MRHIKNTAVFSAVFHVLDFLMEKSEIVNTVRKAHSSSYLEDISIIISILAVK